MKRAVEIAPDIRDLLLRLRIEGNVVYIDQQLDRETYVRLNKILEALGGKWSRKVRGHIFEGDAARKIAESLETGEAVDVKKTFEYFETPSEIANLMVDRAGIIGEHVRNIDFYVLEPSAGQGAIADVVRVYVPAVNIHVVEIQPEHQQTLKEKGYRLIGKNFLKLKKKQLYDRVLMNPPFSKQQDIDHVLHAWKFLEPGGRLVSIMSAGTEFRETKKAKKFRELVDEHGYLEPLPPGSFGESGTEVNTVMVVLDKPQWVK